MISESYERIHRSNLVGMGVLPLCYQNGDTADSLGLDGTESFSVEIDDSLEPRQDVTVTAARADGDYRIVRDHLSNRYPRSRSTTIATAASCILSCAPWLLSSLHV